MITGKLYNWLKWLAQILLPAFGALYIALAALWDLPKPQEVAGTVLAVDFFLGAILGISQVNYANATGAGTIHVFDTPDKTTFHLELDGDPSDLPNMQEVRFKVANPAADAVQPQATTFQKGSTELRE